MVLARYQGRVRLREHYVELYLDEREAQSGGVISTAHPPVPASAAIAGCSVVASGDGGVCIVSDRMANSAAIVAVVELLESDLPGGDAIDITATSQDKKVPVKY